MFARDRDLLADVFDAYPAPTLIVDGDVAVQAANRAAVEQLGLGAEEPLLRRAGDVLHCLNSTSQPRGCGRGAACSDCVIRGAVGRALGEGAVQRRRSFMQRTRGGAQEEVYFLVSAAPIRRAGRELVVLTLEDVTDVARLQALVSRCAGCGRIRDEAQAWRTVEEYFKRVLDLDFTHGLCHACVERLYPSCAPHRPRG